MRVALVCDYPQEDWPSMDLCAQMLLETWQTYPTHAWQPQPVCPSFRARLTRLPRFGHSKIAFNSDRILNRFWDYPHYLRQRVSKFDLFHVCDHTYAHLVHALPPERTGVYCHDINTFRSLVEPAQEPRPRWYQAMVQQILNGLQKAAVVFYSTSEVRRLLNNYQLVHPTRLVQAPYGISPEFSPHSSARLRDAQPLFPPLAQPFILHVGSCIPRKRVDVLLEVFAQLHEHPNLRLVKVSGEWSLEQEQQIDRLNLRSRIDHWHHLSRDAIAELYRRAAVVLLTSEAEGFGLPLIEALACGAIPVVSDIPVLREVAGRAALYCPVGDVPAWVAAVNAVLADATQAPARSLRLAQASQYSWKTHTETIAQAYLQLANQG
ncbi:glycosyltransferase [Myxacorys almedinensis]|uniref:Glycosyltransferase n=1 Tax=Myxacorys almedinensis A TaxID=2690445 RepID=A0A8J7YX29_9CYAN|nr:glycosyltransferase [Myxacorys almedinensis]NDJ16222.1 glycosyltransferase [Myxacorys almedinensis A]